MEDIKDGPEAMEFLKNRVELLESKLQKCIDARKTSEGLRDSQSKMFELIHKELEESRYLVQKQYREAKSIFKNINQGIVLLSKELTIGEQRSEQLDKILEKKLSLSIGRHFTEVLFEDTDLSQDKINQTKSVLSMAIGQPDFAFSVNSHLLPKEFIYRATSGKKILEIDFNPIFDENEDIVQFIVVIRDVTEIRKLKMATEIKEVELKIITELIEQDQRATASFLASVSKYLSRNIELIKTDTCDKATIEELFRNAHTIKGGARNYNFSFMINKVHLVEESYQKIRSNEVKWNGEHLLKEAYDFQEWVNKYTHIFESKIGKRDDAGLQSYIQEMDEVLDACAKAPQENQGGFLKRMMDLSQRRRYLKIREVLAKILHSIPEIATELKKSPPSVHIEDGEIGFSSNITQTLMDVFTHCVRNSLDHGLEATLDRLAAGKPEAGRISLKVHWEEKGIQISLEDDGRGLNLAALEKKAKTQSSRPEDFSTDEQIAQAIFLSGVSTAEKVTSISGRGVGMDAVKAFLKGFGADIEIEFKGPRNRDGFRPFRLNITLPHKYAIQFK